MSVNLNVGNSYGKNAFREVRVTCQDCGLTEITMMQCDQGGYMWACEGCGDKTRHTVHEAESMPTQSAPELGQASAAEREEEP